ncbi:MAG: DUF4350 domain-containing protein, partial [Methanomicrobiales archaeon]|nr:DUF4350 domain-containing protein [Methanomicrobiales archaeon]
FCGVIPVNRRYLFAAVVLVIGFTALSAQLFTSGEEFSRDNVDWNGTSDFFATLSRTREIWSPEDLGGCRTLLILVPDPDPSRYPAYRSFLNRGNRIILVDEEGDANPLLMNLSSSLRVVPGNLSSIDSGYNSPSLLRAYRSREDPLLQNVSVLTMNHPAGVTGGETLADTSILSWMDGDGNARPDRGEVLRAYSVMAREYTGGGELVVIADPSLFINGMTPENTLFLENLRSIPDSCVDQMGSRTISGEILPSVLHLIKGTYIMKIALVASAMFGCALLWWRRHA